ncbi:MAG: 2-dehydropantoate 2-reductase [Gammaproteobacteria bacterium]|jgi:2-dehydropantoate 2-reductase|nr:2-dehydropantoate 2-reductase [Gammaproteobacteria bacterium]
MRILVVGAGAIGGYFGARLAAAGRDVTFLVRPKRAEQLASGLFVRSPKGDVKIAAPKIVTEATLPPPFDLILLSCKSYDLDSAMASIARAVGPATMVLPLLNGESHIDTLKKRFGSGAVLGGQCQISSTLDAQGHVIHLNEMQLLGFGELDGTRSARIEAVNENLSGATFEVQLSTHILQDMWEKWMFIATLAGITCLMRAALGDIATAGGTDIALALFKECSAIAAKNGYAPHPVIGERIRKMLTAPGSTLTASMLRDVESHGKTEHEHVLGDLFARGQGTRAPVLEICLAHMRAYEARRLREG